MRWWPSFFKVSIECIDWDNNSVQKNRRRTIYSELYEIVEKMEKTHSCISLNQIHIITKQTAINRE